MTLLSDLKKIPQRETGGSTALDRFDFQTSWAVFHMIELHRSGEEYAIATEFHDDVVVLDDPKNPQYIYFYQVKTDNSDKWTIARLTYQKPIKSTKSKETSIAAKMYDNKQKFGEYTKRLAVVSNQPSNFMPSTKQTGSFSEISSPIFDEFVAKMQKECSSFTNADGLLYYYIKTEFSLESYQSALLGEFVSYLTNNYGINTCNFKGFFLSVVDQCRTKSKFLKDYNDYNHLITAKFLTKNDMDAWIHDLQSNIKSKPNIDLVYQDLIGFPLGERRKIKAQLSRYELDRLSYKNILAEKIRDYIKDYINSSDIDNMTIKELLDDGSAKVQIFALSIPTVLSNDYIKAGILYEYHANG